MASSTSSGTIEYKTVDDPGSLLLPQETQQTQEEIQVSPTPIPTLPPKPIQYNFFNVRVFGVVIGIVFLWIYIRGLRRK